MNCLQPLGWSWRDEEVTNMCGLPAEYEAADGNIYCAEHARLNWGILTPDAKRRWLYDNGRLHEEQWPLK